MISYKRIKDRHVMSSGWMMRNTPKDNINEGACSSANESVSEQAGLSGISSDHGLSMEWISVGLGL